MTASQIKGKGFQRVLGYNLEKVSRGVAEVLDHSFLEISEETIMKEIEYTKSQRPNLQKFFYHTSINFPPHENLSNKVMKRIANDYLQKNGFTNHQFIVFRHYDADHPHLHILVNRIDNDGNVLSDSNDFARSERVIRELEKKYKLTQVASSRQAKSRSLTKNEMEMANRNGITPPKLRLQKLITKILSSKRKLTVAEFVKALEAKGVNVLLNQASTGYVSGISYSYEGMTIKGAKLGNDFKWTTLKDKLDYNQERDRFVTSQTNDKLRHKQDTKTSKAADQHASPIPLIHKENHKPELDHTTIATHLLEDLINPSTGAEIIRDSTSIPKKKKRKRRKRS